VKIEKYTFGEMVIDGRSYTNDLKIICDMIIPDWWRNEGHSLCLDDISDILDAKPKTFVIGCGYSGILEVPHALKDNLLARGINIIDLPTEQAVNIFNDTPDFSAAAFAFHLTC
jgi:hypothetical protein